MYSKEMYLQQIEDVINRGPYKANWDSLSAHETPAWFRDAKFGIFIHWGAYSIPAFGKRMVSAEYVHTGQSGI